MIQERTSDQRENAKAARRAERIRAARAGELVWMDAEEAAEYLNVDAARFRKAAAAGDITRYKDLGGYRYHRDDLDQYRTEKLAA